MAIGGAAATLVVKIVSEAKDAVSGMDKVGEKASGVQKTLGAVGAASGVAAAGLAAIAISGVNAASDLQQSAGAVEAVFGKYADSVKAASEQASSAVGLSQSEYQSLAAVIGSQLKNTGTAYEDLGGQTDQLIALGSDLAATYGGSVSDAVSAISSLMRGERDPIERYGVTINQAAIDAYKAANGLDTLTGAAASQATGQAALALLFEQTASAQGQFARESDTLAVQQQMLNSSWTDAQAALGTALLPILTAAAEVLTTVAKWAAENGTAFQILIGVLAGVTAGVWLLNVAMNANPIGLIITAIGVLIALITVAVIWIISNWDSIVAAIEAGVAAIAEWWNGLVAAIQTAWETYVVTPIENAIAAIVEWWTGLVEGITALWEGFVGFISDAIANIQAAWEFMVAGIQLVWDAYVQVISDGIEGIAQWWDDLVSGVSDAWDGMVGFLADAWDGFIGGISDGIDAMIGWIQDAINWFGSLFGAANDAGSAGRGATSRSAAALSAFGLPTAASPLYAAPSIASSVAAPSFGALLARTKRIAAETADSRPNVTVNGALDPNAVARQIRAVLTRYGRNTGVLPAGGRLA